MPYKHKFSGAYETPPVALERVRKHAYAAEVPTPYLVCDLDVLDLKVARFKEAMPSVQPYYAMKANPDARVITRLKGQGVRFEIASIYELERLIACGVEPRDVLFSNPIKPAAAIRRAWEQGVSTMAVDDLDEIIKIAGISPDIQMYLRLETSNTGSDWPLTGKFGSSTAEAMEIIEFCARERTRLIGLTFHVGSQCRNLDNWHTGIEGARLVFARMREEGLTPSLLNLGGGFPVQHTRPIPTIGEIGATVRKSLAGLGSGIRVIAEPGRYLVGDSCWMVTRVVGTATRKGRRWVYLDVGAFTGLAETLEKFDYELITERSGPLTPTSVAGPSCDTADTLFDEKMLPEDLVEGDFVYIPNAGAYTTAYASTFNGFPLPQMVLFSDTLKSAALPVR